MSSIPSFIRPGYSGQQLVSKSKYLKLEAGAPVEIIPLTGVEPPTGTSPSGKNCVISYSTYTYWLTKEQLAELPENTMSPSFPALGGEDDPGLLLGLEPKFRALMVIMKNDGDEDEYVWGFGISVFKQLVEIEQALGESIRGHILRVFKTGSGMSTKYRVVPTGKVVEIDGVVDTNLLEYIGPTTRESIVETLTNVGVWPPPGGDPYASKPAKPAKSGVKVGAAHTEKPMAPKSKQPPKPAPVDEPADVDPDGEGWEDEDFEEPEE